MNNSHLLICSKHKADLMDHKYLNDRCTTLILAIHKKQLNYKMKEKDVYIQVHF